MKKLNIGIAKQAIPLILSNLTVPLLGFTNTYIAGHLHNTSNVAAVGLGVMVFNLLFWAFAFLRMGTTGLVAQAYGQGGAKNTLQTISHSLVLSLCIGIVIVIFRDPIGHVIFGLIDGDVQVKAVAQQYYSYRILAAPATLFNYVLIGSFIGLQNMLLPLVIMMTVNGLAIIFGLELSFVYHLSVKGIAIADVIAQYSGAIVGTICLLKRLGGGVKLHEWRFNFAFFRKLTQVNSDIFLRTLFLIAAFSFFTLQSLKLGPAYLAANTILMSFMTLTSFAQDGFANVAETLVGRNIGRGDYEASAQAMFDAGSWAAIIAVSFSVCYLLFGHSIINMMTSFTDVRIIASYHLLFIILLPLISVACFFFDGVFIGANKFKEMRNTMLGAFAGYLCVWWLLRQYGNIGLWISILSFFGFRGMLMGAVFWFNHRKKSFFAICKPITSIPASG
jgi:MATE family multidrug resistance protein